MRERDRAFLNNYIQFVYMNHVLGAVSFYETGRDADTAAGKLRALIHDLDDAHASQMAKDLNDGVRMQRIAVARLYAEYVATMEDFGALCEATLHRKEAGGICQRYVNNEPKHVTTFFHGVKANGAADLSQMLDLPVPQVVAAKLPADWHASVAEFYAATPLNIRRVADNYCDTPAGLLALSTPYRLPADWADFTNILLDIWDSEGAVPDQRRGGIAVRTYNKIKHCFMVIDDMEEFAQLANPKQSMYWVAYGLSQSSVEKLMMLIKQIALSAVDLASFLSLLDTYGVALD